MPEQDKPFVVNDRRKHRMDGELREPLPQTPAEPAQAEPKADAEQAAGGPTPINSAHLVTPAPEPAAADASADDDIPPMPPPPTEAEIEQVRFAYEQTVERLDTMMRAGNPGAEHMPPMDFTRLVQSVYMSAMVQLGAGTEQGQQARVDLLGAKQSIEMLAIIGEKTRSSLTDTEQRLVEAALFELRMGFLEITQLLARQAAAKQGAPTAAPGQPTGFGGGGFTGDGPRIVR